MDRAVWMRSAAMLGMAAAFIGGALFGTRAEQARQPWARERLLSTALDSVRINFLDSLPESELLRRAVSGMLRELNDPYAALLERDGVSAYRGTLRGDGQGLGLVLRLRGRDVVVRRVLAGSPAASAGVRAGDVVLAVDGRVATEAWNTPRPDAGLKDSAGLSSDTIQLLVARATSGDSAALQVVRAPWHMPAVTEALLIADGVGYTRLATTSTGSADELERAVEQLRARGARSLILDLRGNVGGLFEEGVQAASLFLDRGVIVASIERRGDVGGPVHRARRSRWPELPMVVLIDQNTASAAEIIAGALRDHNRALLVGENSFGKGLVQRVVSINPDMALRLTTARWLPPSGTPLVRREDRQGVVTGGLTPDLFRQITGRLDPSALPLGMPPATARAMSDAIDVVVTRALHDGWSSAPVPLLERRLRGLLVKAVVAIDTDPVRQVALLGDGTRVAMRRLLEVAHDDETLWRYAALDDPVLRAGLDVVAPGATTSGAITDAVEEE